MANDALNFFRPFRRLEPGHENQLTRALLVVLRLSPMAHAVWLGLVAPERALYHLPEAQFDTQRRSLPRAGEGEEMADLVSVFLTPEEPLSGPGVVTEADRGQVLDAIIDYGGELLVVVENKVAEADAWQASNVNVTGARVRIKGQEVRVVLWRDVLEAFAGLREGELVAGAEAAVLEDFLTYVEDHFAELGPFRTLALCQNNRTRQARRLRQLLGEVSETEATVNAHGPYIDLPGGDQALAARAFLRFPDDPNVDLPGRDSAIELVLYPADTLTQARAFYQRPQALAGLRCLVAQPGWEARPNFHFGHMQRGYVWTDTSLDVEAYVGFWREHIDDTRTVPADKWNDYWAWLERERIASPDDRAEFDRVFINTDRSTASPRPGLALSRHWTLADAEILDGRGALTPQIRDALDAVLACFDEPPLTESTAAA